MNNEFDGLVAAVTGGASGIGLEVVEQLSDRGCTVVVLDRELSSSPGQVGIQVQCDVSDRRDVDTAFATIGRELGRLDVLVNNAGIAARGLIEQIEDDELLRVLNVNVAGMFRCTRAALPLLRRSEHASVVNTCSVAAVRGMPGLSAYSASKGAVLAMTRSLAADFIDEGIRVNCVCPGTVDTPWVERQLAGSPDADRRRRALIARQPMARLIDASEVARSIVFLASPQSGSMTATALEVDGGLAGLSLAGREAIDVSR